MEGKNSKKRFRRKTVDERMLRLGNPFLVADGSAQGANRIAHRVFLHSVGGIQGLCRRKCRFEGGTFGATVPRGRQRLLTHLDQCKKSWLVGITIFQDFGIMNLVVDFLNRRNAFRDEKKPVCITHAKGGMGCAWWHGSFDSAVTDCRGSGEPFLTTSPRAVKLLGV